MIRDIWDALTRLRWFVIIALLCAVGGVVLVPLGLVLEGFALLGAGLVVATLEERM